MPHNQHSAADLERLVAALRERPDPGAPQPDLRSALAVHGSLLSSPDARERLLRVVRRGPARLTDFAEYRDVEEAIRLHLGQDATP